jgi:hypothetical protein
VRIWTTTRRWYGQIKRGWGTLRSRLRRERAALALLTLLTLGLGEPLLCIMHCQIWLPIAYQSHFAAQQQHAHHGHHTQHGASDGVPAAAPPAGSAAVLPHAPANDPGCMMPRVSGSTDGVPFHVPPSPVHDALPAFLTLFFAALLLHARPAAPPGDPPRHTWRPPLRPPILFAR